MNQVKLEISIYIISLCDIKIIMQRIDQRFLGTLECKNYHMGTFYLFKHPFLTTKSTFFLRNKDKEHHAEQESADDTKSELVHSVMEQQVLEVHLQITTRIIRF